MITKQNYFILLSIIAVLVLAYMGILGLTGFTKYWGHFRMIAFYVMSVAIFFVPLALLVKLYSITHGSNNIVPDK